MHYRTNKNRSLDRVLDGSEWLWVHPKRRPRHVAVAVVRRGQMVITQALDCTPEAATAPQLAHLIGKHYDTPSAACTAIDPSTEYNGYAQWVSVIDPNTTLDDVERGRKL